MSHKATNWAVTQRGLKPAVKVLLWHLADRHNVDNGCFPDQASLARDCEMSRASINRHLDELESRGLIRRVQRVDPITKKQLSTRYILAFEDDFRTQDVVAHVSNCDTDPCLKNGESRVSKSAKPVSHSYETLTCKGTGKEPNSSLRSESARDRFDEFEDAYPKPMGSDRAKARKCFLALSEAERATAIAGAEALKAERESDRKSRGESLERSQRFTPNASRWLAGRSWESSVPAPVNAGPLVSIKQGTPEFEAVERLRGRPIHVGMSRKITVKQSELDAALAAERQTA